MPEETPPLPPEFPIEAALRPECDALRAELLAIEKRVRALLRNRFPDPDFDWKTATPQIIAQIGEMRDHQMLAVRAIEDSRMRIGKVLQHARDGVSIYDKG
jgi:hypothetical protein